MKSRIALRLMLSIMIYAYVYVYLCYGLLVLPFLHVSNDHRILRYQETLMYLFHVYGVLLLFPVHLRICCLLLLHVWHVSQCDLNLIKEQMVWTFKLVCAVVVKFGWERFSSIYAYYPYCFDEVWVVELWDLNIGSVNNLQFNALFIVLPLPCVVFFCICQDKIVTDNHRNVDTLDQKKTNQAKSKELEVCWGINLTVDEILEMFINNDQSFLIELIL